VQVGLAHAQFETIDPFLDGNGLYLSHYFKRHRAEYYDQLQAVRDRGEFETWLAFFLRGVGEVSVKAMTATSSSSRKAHDHRRDQDPDRPDGVFVDRGPDTSQGL
jgi:Fic family protein